MKEEKRMILSMLEEGKITTEEALELLEAIEETEGSFSYDNSEEYIDSKEKIKEEIRKSAEEIRNNARKTEGFGSNLGSLISNIVNSIVDKSTSFNLSGLYETINTKIEKDISNIENPIIDLEALNGSINARSWDKDKISMDITIKYRNKDFPNATDFYKFYEEDNVFRFRPIHRNNLIISLDINLPNKYYEEIILKTSNGKVSVNDLELGYLTVKTSNGSINIDAINSKDINLSTQNGRILLNHISSPAINGKTSNGSVSLQHINSQNLNISTINGKIRFMDINSENISGKTSNSSIELEDAVGKIVKLRTSNGSIVCKNIDEEKIGELNLSTSNSSISVDLNNTNKPKYFDLETSIGNISLDIPDLVYKVNKKDYVGSKRIIAHSVNFNEEKEYFHLKASTSNGSITIR
ncbi:MAG: DUF4097 family beta strand repeat protein [Tissierellia bacterium]|nr:DUF4097 family beta strand repeat protein [Tissierellia bacterium]